MAIGGLIKAGKAAVKGLEKPKGLDSLMDEFEEGATARPVLSVDELLDEAKPGSLEFTTNGQLNPESGMAKALKPKPVIDEILDSFSGLEDVEQSAVASIKQGYKDIPDINLLPDQFLDKIAQDVHKGLISSDQGDEKIFDLIDDTKHASGDDIDLDLEIVTENTPNSPISFKEQVDELYFEGDEPQFIARLDDNQQRGMSAMMQIRSSGFLDLKEDLIQKNYSREDATYPPRDLVDSLEEEHFLAINFYTHNGDSPMNAMLRQGNVDFDTDLGQAIEMTQTALGKLPSWDPADGNVYRRVSDRNIKAIFDELEVGSEYTEKGFTSTTREQIVDEVGAPKPGQGGGSPLTFIIKPKEGGNGKPIEGLSNWSLAEREVLFQHGTKFRIVAKRETTTALGDPATLLFVEEI